MTDDSPGEKPAGSPHPGRRSSFTGHPGEAALLALAFVLVNLAGAWFQPQITKDGGKGWEGIDYYALADQWVRGERPLSADAPMVYRVGTPALAALVHRAGWDGGNLFTAFRGVNLVGNALALAGLVAWLRRFLGDWRIRVAFGLAWLLQWDTPTRWLWFYPAHTDPWMWVFLFAGLLALERYRNTPTGGRLAVLTVLGAVGVVFREVVAVVPLALLFSATPLRRDAVGGRWRLHVPRWVIFVPLAVTFVVLLALHRGGLIRPADNFAFGGTALHWLHAKPPWVYVHSWLAAFGPGVLALILSHWRQARDFLAGRQDLVVYLVAFAVLGQIGGTDTERLLYWSMPVIFVLAGRALETPRAGVFSSPALLTTLVGVQLVVSRAAFWPIPDYPGGEPVPPVVPFLTPLGARVPYLDLFSFFAERRVELALLGSNLLVLGVLTVWLVRRQGPPAGGRRLPDAV